MKERSHSEADGEGSGEGGAQVMFSCLHPVPMFETSEDVPDVWLGRGPLINESSC